MNKQYFSRPIRLTASGVALARDCQLAAYSIVTGSVDLVIHLTDGAGGQKLWSVEADSAASSPNMSFGSYPLRFPNGLYVEFSQPEDNTSVSLAVVEPYSKA